MGMACNKRIECSTVSARVTLHWALAGAVIAVGTIGLLLMQ